MPSLSRKAFLIVDAVLMQVIWVSGVVYQEAGLPFALLAIITHFLLSPERQQDALILLRIAPIGIALDYGLMQSGIFIFPQNTLPLWLVFIWCGFAMTMRHSLAWLAQSKIILQASIGAVGGTLSYYSGVKFAAVSFGVSTNSAILILVVIWAIVMPLCCYLSKQDIFTEKT